MRRLGTPLGAKLLALGLLGGGNLQYYQQVKNLLDTNLFRYWPLWEADGAVAADQSANADNGAYSAGVLYGQTGIGDGRTSCYFDGTSRVNVYTSSLVSGFPTGELFISAFIKIPAAVWTDNTLRYLISFRADVNNRITIEKPTNANWLLLRYLAGGTNKTVTLTNITQENLLHVALTVSVANGRLRGFLNGSQFGLDVTGLGTWVGSLDPIYCALASQAGTANVSNHIGGLAHVVVGSREATPLEIAKLSHYSGSDPIGVCPVGDSKTASAQAGITEMLTVLREQTGQNWAELPYRLGVSGITTALFKARIDADIAAIPANVRGLVRWIPYNMGANDCLATIPFTKAQWKADTEYILSALMAGFPNAQIPLARVWRRAIEAQIPTRLAEQQAARTELIAAYPSRLRPGMDEYAVLEAGNDGATWTSDGVHPTDPGGYTREWTAGGISWKTVLGY
jgi:hypothetical protein